MRGQGKVLQRARHPRAGGASCKKLCAERNMTAKTQRIAPDRPRSPSGASLLFRGLCKVWRLAYVLMHAFFRARSYVRHDARHSRLARIAKKVRACHGVTTKYNETCADPPGSPRWIRPGGADPPYVNEDPLIWTTLNNIMLIKVERRGGSPRRPSAARRSEF